MPRHRPLTDRPFTLAHRLVASVFVLVFGAAMVFMAYRYTSLVTQTWQARHWVEVPAQILTVEEVRGVSTSTPNRPSTITSAVRSTFTYTYGGKNRASTQAGLSNGLDNFSNDYRRRIREAAAAPAPTAWVNPEQPDQAVLVRSLPWEQVLFYAAFLVFPCGFVSIMALGWAGVFADRMTGRKTGFLWAARAWAVLHGALALPIIALGAPLMGWGGWLVCSLLLALMGAGLWRSWRAFSKRTAEA